MRGGTNRRYVLHDESQRAPRRAPAVARGDGASGAHPRARAAVLQRRFDGGNHLHARHNGGYQSCCIVVWRQVVQRRRDYCHRDGAPFKHCALATVAAAQAHTSARGACQREGRTAPGHLPRHVYGEHPPGGNLPRVKRAGHCQPRKGDDCRSPQARRAGARRRRPERTAHESRRAGYRRGFLCVLSPQDVWTDWRRCALRKETPARVDDSISRRRRDDWQRVV